MKRTLVRRFLAAGMAVLAGSLASCCCDDEGDGGPHDGGRPGTEVVYDEPCCENLRYFVEVSVACPAGRAIPGAGVELVVAAVPEQRLYGYADGGGVAYFEVDCPPDVTLVAFAVADGFESNGADMGTTPDGAPVRIAVTLYPLY